MTGFGSAVRCYELFAAGPPHSKAASRHGRYCDLLAYLGLFTGLVFAFRAAGEYMMPTYVDVHGGLHNSIRWLLAAATGYWSSPS